MSFWSLSSIRRGGWIRRWLPEVLYLCSLVLFVPATFASSVLVMALDKRIGGVEAAEVGSVIAAGFSLALQAVALVVSLVAIRHRRAEGLERRISALAILSLSAAAILGALGLVGWLAYADYRWKQEQASAALHPAPPPSRIVELSVQPPPRGSAARMVFLLGEKRYESTAELVAALKHLKATEPRVRVRVFSSPEVGFSGSLEALDACARAGIADVE